MPLCVTCGYLPIENVHGFLKERIGQKRGLPIIHTALNRSYRLDKYDEAALLSAEIGAAKAAFLKWEEGISGPCGMG